MGDISLHKAPSLMPFGPGSLLEGSPMTTEDGKTGKPTIDNGEYLDPYNIPSPLIGEVGLAGPKGADGKRGERGDPGPPGENSVHVAIANGTSQAAEPPLESSAGVTRAMLLQLVLFNLVCLGFIYFSLKKRIQLVEQVQQAIDEIYDESYLSMSFTIANVNYADIEALGSQAEFEEMVKDVMSRAAVAAGAAGVSGENVAVALGDGDDNSTLVSATMSPPEGSTSVILQEAMKSGQLQSLLPPAVDAAAGAETFKKGTVFITDLEISIEGTGQGPPPPDVPEVGGEIQEL